MLPGFFDTLLADVSGTQLLLCAFVSVTIGALWLSSSLFGNLYHRCVSRTPRPHGVILPLVAHFFRSAFVAAILAILLHHFESRGFDTAWWMVSAFLSCGIAIAYLSEILSRGGPLVLWLIGSSYITVSIFAMAAILAL